MALITIQRNTTLNDNNVHNISINQMPKNETNEENVLIFEEHTHHCLTHQKSVNECYFAVRGAAIILPHEECMHVYKSLSKNHSTVEIQKHLQSMFLLLRPNDTLKMAVKLESTHKRIRYLIVVNESQSNEESCLLGIDYNTEATIGLVLPVWADTGITLDGDGGFSITSSGKHHIFKPVSVQAMWSALQALHRASSKSRENNNFEGGTTHSWISYYEKRISSDRSCLNEWHAMEDLVYRRPHSPDLRTKPCEQIAIEQLIRAKLKEVMMSVDLDEVTSKYIRTKLEEELKIDLNSFKSFIDEEMLTILGQMDEPSEIFEYLYLGSEWNASNYEELKGKGVAKILNVTREIDNFFPGMFDYYNIRVYDDDSTEMLKYWDKTFRYIRKAKDEGSKVLVHCKKGISRSASVVLAFVMKERGWDLDKAIQFVKNKRNCIHPNSGFLKQLEIYQGILDASKQRHNSLWRSKSETNLVSKDNCLNRKSHEEFSNAKNRIHKQSNFSNDNKENSNNENFLSIPGSVERPKSWSPEDFPYNEIFPKQFNTNNSCNKEIKNRRSFTGRQRFGTDPSCYYIVEAKKNIESKHIDNSNSDIYNVQNSQPPKISIVKDRITDFETFPQIQSGISNDSLKTTNNSGLVRILANEFESSNSNAFTKKVNQINPKQVMVDLSNIEHNQKTGLQSKPPIPKPLTAVDKIFMKCDSHDDYEKVSQKIPDLFDLSPNISQNYRLNPLSNESKEHLIDIKKYYMKEQSSELEPKSESKVVNDRKVKAKKIIENSLRRTNSYESISTNLSLSLSDKRNSESCVQKESLERPQNSNSKSHKRSSSLYSGNNKWTPLPSLTTQLPPVRLCSSLNEPNDGHYLNNNNNNNNIVHSKSMPSVVEAVNEVISSIVVMNSLIESIPISKNKSLNCMESVDNNQMESSFMSTNPAVNSASLKENNLINNENHEKSRKETLVLRLAKQIEAKAKGNSCVSIEKVECEPTQQHSKSTPSSPNLQNSRPRSSTFNDLKNAENVPLVPPLRKTSLELHFKRSKSQTTYDNEIQSNRVFNVNNNMENSSCSSTKLTKTSKKCSLPSLQTNINIQSQLCIKSSELHKKQSQKKLQHGRSHPLTRLMPQNSKFKNCEPLLNTM